MGQPNTSLGYFKGLDMLRFIAASCVLLHHVSLSLTNKNIYLYSHRYHQYSGSFFLDLFFVISGFLIAIILFTEFRSGIFSLRKFFMRRILRIWPLFFFIVLVKIVLIPGKGVSGEEIATNLKYAFTFTVNFQLLFAEYKSTYKILWSVCVEEQLYLIFPFLALLFKKWLMALAIVLIGIGMLSWFFVSSFFEGATGGYNPAYFFPTSYLYYFGLGALLAVLYYKYQSSLWSGRFFSFLSAKSTQVVMIVTGLAFVFNAVTNQPYSVGALLLLNGLFSFYLVFLALSGKLVLDVAGLKTTRFAGNISYAMYLVHPMMMAPSFRIIKNIAPSGGEFVYTVLLPLIALLLTIGLSTILHYSIERPFLKLKKRFVQIENK